MAYLLSKFLQTDGGLYHPSLASLLLPTASGRAPSLRGHCPASSLLRTRPPGSRLRRASPLDSRDYLSPRVFSVGRGALPCFIPWPCARAAALYPAGRRLRRSLSEAPVAFAITMAARHPERFVFRGLYWAFTLHCGPRTRSPRQPGLCRWASPTGSPSPAPPKLCGFDLLPPFGTFTLRTHGNLQASHRDDKFGPLFDRVARGAGTRVVRTAVQAPLMNSVCEGFLGSVRRECLGHLIILSETHLQRVLAEYALRYFNSARPTRGSASGSPSQVNASEPAPGRSRRCPCSVGFITTTGRRHDRGG